MGKYTDRDTTPLSFHHFYVALAVLRALYGVFLIWSGYSNDSYSTNIVTGGFVALINIYILINSSAWKKSVLVCIIVYEIFFAIAMMTLALMYVKRVYDPNAVKLSVVFAALGVCHLMTLSYYIKRRKLFNGKSDKEIEEEKLGENTIPSPMKTSNNEVMKSNEPTKKISTEKQPHIYPAVSQTANVKMFHTNDVRETDELVSDKEMLPHSKGSEPNQTNSFDAIYPEGNEKISELGTKHLSQVRFCRKCGLKLNEGELFCRKCGTKL